MELTTIEKVKARLSLSQDDDEKVDAAITSAMAAGDHELSARLQTKFVSASYEDRYNANADRVFACDGFFRIKTSVGFIQEDSLVVSQGYSLAEARTGDVVIPSADLVIDLEKGLVLIPEEYIGTYIVCKYDAGFGSQTEVPEWLQEVATNHAITILSIHQMDDKNPELTTTLKILQDSIILVLNGHLRANVTCLNPIR